MRFVVEGDVNSLAMHEVQTMTQAFYHHSRFEVVSSVYGDGLVLKVCCFDSRYLVELYESGVLVLQKEAAVLKAAIYDVLSAYTGISLPWGLLTGIRPAKLAAGLITERGKGGAERWLREFYGVSRDKAALCIEVAENQRAALQNSVDGSVSVYIAVAFCPTRCDYCSFAAYPVDKFARYMGACVDTLIDELGCIAELVKGRHVESVYIGGGTPTALDNVNLERLLNAVNQYFDIDNVKEYTIEAGRPDTIDDDKLAIMKAHKASRISINPQSLNNSTLQAIGRRHSADDFFKAFERARGFDFRHINVDIILGLYGERLEDVQNTLSGIMPLTPESVTVHTLAVKRASRLKEGAGMLRQEDFVGMEEMLVHVRKAMDEMGLAPYYMYRQKNSPGNFENVGYAKPGFESLYNIQMMEEQQTILAAGAGAITKIVMDGRVERVANPKQIDDYIGRIQELKAKKQSAYTPTALRVECASTLKETRPL